jgi:hypothetical protein
MKHLLTWPFIPGITFLVLTVLLFGACRQTRAGEVFADEKRQAAPEAETLWEHITKTDPYKTWKPFPAKGKEGLYFAVERGPVPAKNPHGAYMKLFVNKIAIDSAQQNQTGSMPNGAILVMENYGRDKQTLLSISAMYKVTGFAPEQGDWFWASYGPDGKAIEGGRLQSCIDCHRARRHTDWRYAGSRGRQHQGHQGHK